VSGMLSTVAVVVAMYLSAAAEPLSAVPRAADTWQVVLAGDKPFGSIHTIVHKEPAGTWSYRRVSRTLVDFLGQREELNEDFRCTVTGRLEPVSFTSTSRSATGTVEARGSVVDGQLRITLKRREITFERRIPLVEKPIFGVCLVDALRARPKSDETVTLHVISSGAWFVERLIAHRLSSPPGQTRWQLDDEWATQSGVLSIDEQHKTVESASSFPRTRTRTCDEKVAANLQWHAMPPRELLMFPLDRDLPFPERLRSATVRLTWKGAAPQGLELTDLHQRIVKETRQGDVHRVELRLDHAVKPAASPRFPVTDPSLANSLGPTDFIDPRADAIQKQAREWTKGCTTAQEAVEQLCRHVSEYLNGGELIAETLSGPEVLACRKGKCSEYTTLFASLSRSVGIPTRVALGMRLAGGNWVGHMWCEAYVGQWIPVDATANEVGGSPALLKLTHSANVMGTQKARWGLAETLEVSVLSVLRPDGDSPTVTTGIVRGVYTNGDFACRLTAPADDWKVEDQSKPGVTLIRWRPPGKFADNEEPLIHFVAFSLPTHIEPALLIKARMTRAALMSTGFEVLKEESAKVAGVKRERIVFRRKRSKTSDRKVKVTELIWIEGRSGFLLNLIAEESVHDRFAGSFERLLASFERLPTGKKSASK
jgi:transglutaminase-like putative cysteine protease